MAFSKSMERGWPKWAKMSGSGDQCEFLLSWEMLISLPKTLLWWTLGDAGMVLSPGRKRHSGLRWFTRRELAF